jgi:hypothetical protein
VGAGDQCNDGPGLVTTLLGGGVSWPTEQRHSWLSRSVGMLHFGHDLADMEFMRGHRATPVWPSLAANVEFKDNRDVLQIRYPVVR